MTNKEAARILAQIDNFYPNFMKGEPEKVKFKMKSWRDVMIHWDYEATKQRLDEYILDSPYPPKISDIKPHTQVKYSIKDQLDEIYGDLDD